MPTSRCRKDRSTATRHPCSRRWLVPSYSNLNPRPDPGPNPGPNSNFNPSPNPNPIPNPNPNPNQACKRAAVWVLMREPIERLLSRLYKPTPANASLLRVDMLGV